MVRYLDVSAVLDVDRPQPERCYMTSVALDVLEGKLRESMEQVLKHGEKFRKYALSVIPYWRHQWMCQWRELK